MGRLFKDYANAEATGERGKYLAPGYRWRLRLTNITMRGLRKKGGLQAMIANFTVVSVAPLPGMVMTTESPRPYAVGESCVYFVNPGDMFDGNAKALILALHHSLQLSLGQDLTIPTEADAEAYVFGRLDANGALVPETDPRWHQLVPGFFAAGFEVECETTNTKTLAKTDFTVHAWKPCAFTFA